MKKAFLFLYVFCVSTFAFCSQVEFLTSLSEKEAASFSDCVKCFCYLNDIQPTDDFKGNVKLLQEKLAYMPRKFSADKALTIGDFSLLAMQFLNIKSGLLYLATKSGRYASRELMQLNIIPFNTSEWKKISGIDLIRLLQKVDEYAEAKKNK